MTEEQKHDTENKKSDQNTDDASNISSLSKKSKNLNEENSKEKNFEVKILELEDKIARTLAEMENQRRRFEKEKEEAFEYGGFTFAKEALNLIDNLERSKQILESDDSLKNSDALAKTLEHLDIINKDLISIFSKNNIKQIDSLNKKLDPNFHQAMMEIEDDQKEPGTIIQEIQKGFTIKDRLLRPALVGVSKISEKKSTKNVENKEVLDEK